MGVLLLMDFAAILRAGSVVKIGDGSEADGKVTLGATSVHVDGSFATDINLPDILEADFAEGPFHVDYFSSDDSPSSLPPDWKAQDIGPVAAPGAFSYASGEFTLTANQSTPAQKDEERADHYFAGIPWTGDGQWTVRLKSAAAGNGAVRGGMILRDSLDPLSHTTGLSTWDLTNIFPFARTPDGYWNSHVVGIDGYPIWFRMTREGAYFDYDLSDDGRVWRNVGENAIGITRDFMVGFFVESYPDKSDRKIVLDHALFTPPPGLSPSQVVPTGVLLRSGTFLAGNFSPFDFNNATPVGTFYRNGKDGPISISAARTAAVIYHPTDRTMLDQFGSHVGVLLRNGDLMDGAFESINDRGVILDSVAFGAHTFYANELRACSVNPQKLQSSDYEVRLTDGSMIRASGVTAVDQGKIAITEVSGITITVASEEVAQLRAGTSRVETLLSLPWKSTAPKPANSPSGATNATPNGNPAPVANATPPTSPASGETPSLPCWTGRNQEQIVAVPIGTTIEFPLKGKVRAVGARIALSPGSPPNSNATIRVLVNGKEVARTPAFEAGAGPRFMEVTLTDPKTVTFVADSSSPGVQVLLIDPIAVRENSGSTP